ncbi:MAG: peptide ABC transporter substrate-binding protein [Fimbriimonadaceae bacterium]|nr:peptide ABC transporter substrate-binding protein [Fimbriimonadaceae bacterium]
MRYTGILLVFAALLAVAGCGKGNFSDRVKSAQRDVFRYPIPNNPTTLDPGVVQDGDTIDLLQNVYEGLVGWSTENTVEPRLAESWDISEDGTVYTFHLKKGVKFHSGREVTAEDFKWTFERNCYKTDPNKFSNETAGVYLTDIVGVREKCAGTANDITGIKVVDPYTLTITIDKPRPYFLGKLTFIVSAVLDKDIVPMGQEINKPELMVSTGPFKCTEYVQEQVTVLEAFEDYHGGKSPVAKIERPVIKDAATRLNKYKAGEIDLVQLQRQDIEGVEKDPAIAGDLVLFERPSTWYIGLNADVLPPLRDKRVRQAIAMSIDKDQIVNGLMKGVNSVANGLVPPGVFGHRKDAKALPYDPDRARQLLAEAGYPGGKGFPQLTIYYRESYPDIQLVAVAVTGMIKENLGIDAKGQTMEWRAFLEKNNAKKQPFVHMRWAADYLDPENYLSFLLASYGPENRLNHHNPEYDRLCAMADTELNPEKRKQLYAQAEDIGLDDAVIVPIYYQRDAELISPRVKGIRSNLFGHLAHTTLKLENAPK